MIGNAHVTTGTATGPDTQNKANRYGNELSAEREIARQQVVNRKAQQGTHRTWRNGCQTCAKA